jgi:hypothetical protein
LLSGSFPCAFGGGLTTTADVAAPERGESPGWAEQQERLLYRSFHRRWGRLVGA